MKRWTLLASAGLVLGLAGCGTEATDVAAAREATATVAPASTPSESVMAEVPYWDEERLAALEAAKAQFTPPPAQEASVSSYAPAVAVPVPAPVVTPEDAWQPVPEAAPQPDAVPTPTVEPTPDGSLSNEAFVALVDEILDVYEARRVTTKQAMEQLRQLQVDYPLTAAQQDALNYILGELQKIFDAEHQGQWNIGDIKVPTTYEVRRLMP